ncbi:thioredoxin family protein [Listeria cornellensis]|uniref:Thioredoxin n=1 Tax=Listeria cornellensis FSL F6-0969 TaxID=1265820 RepID=W7C0H8_9LIST|nr:thioredoxin family protein [Listeria cornellensis]EUJ32894.1 thioredoxin [Listeria cornellensis FSL F6-0969]
MKYIIVVITIIFIALSVACSNDVGINKVEKSEEILSLLNDGSKETTFVYFGRQNCPYCKKFYPKLEKVVNENRMNVYYYDTKSHKGDTDFEKVLSEYGVEEIPYLAKVKDGKIMGVLNQAQNEKEVKTFMDQ